VEGKSPPPDFNLKILPQFFNTPGTEVAPGSDIVRKYFKIFWCHHAPFPV
jgi:hypothetical protein